MTIIIREWRIFSIFEGAFERLLSTVMNEASFPMKFLHTSDWHLGRSLYGRKRYEEFEAFLDWLARTLEDEGVDALLVAGDVFDTGTPGNRAQEMYYRFLCRVAAGCCRHVVVIAGNHDSPSFLDAPKDLLRVLNVHVMGAVTGTPADQVILLSDEEKTGLKPDRMALICAVPYLRDKDIRTVEPGESLDDKNVKLVEGIKKHYAEVVAAAEEKRIALLKTSMEDDPCPKIPIIAMGHLFTAGGKTVDGDGVRDLYVGSLAHVGQEAFPASIDYLALGHLHVPQRVGDAEHIRYSGSPIPMGFGEARQQKSVVVIDIKETSSGSIPTSAQSLNPLTLRLVPVPCFQPLERVSGAMDTILAGINQLKLNQSRAWLEIEYTGEESAGTVRDRLDEALDGSEMEIRRIKNKRAMDRVLRAMEDEESLDDLDVNDVFERCLDAFEVPPEDRVDLIGAYREIIQGLLEEDNHAH